MHVLIIPSWYKSETDPYAGTFFEDQVRMLHKNGVNVGVLFPHHISSFCRFIKNPFFNRNIIIDNGIFTIYSNTKSIVPGNIGFTVNKKIIEEYSFKTFLRYCNINGMPDIIHSHSVFWGAIAANSISKKAGIPFIHTEHLSAIIYSDEYDHHPFCGFIIECLNGSKKNIFVSEKFKEAVEKKYSVKDAITIPNIVNPIFFNKKRSGLPLSTFNIINIGAHIDTKNQTTLLRSLEILRKSIDKDIKLVIVGHGPLYGQLSQQAKSLMSGITVEFLHSANKEVIAELMSRSHLLISTSLFETFGLTVAEANAVGLPVVSYRTMGAEDIVTPQNGLLVSDNSPEMFAAAMIEIYKNYWEYDPEIISADCLCKFSEKVIAPQIIGIYEKILEGKNNSGYE